ncbi:hypothetical protein PAPYR_4336 [Paratrimastix pyriformis]|uniref:Uncharacterized protein n=1 Tax=Paratrimastix pyriformis TaxID=342808 RepID=A0ABQ8UPY8_9EUKA|nr:hypothetical protein PAPYR_4336 [Paratrimastix pyriformis]
MLGRVFLLGLASTCLAANWLYGAVTHPYNKDPEKCGNTVEFFQLDSETGLFADSRWTLTVDPCPNRIRFYRDKYAIVLNSNDHAVNESSYSVTILRRASLVNSATPYEFVSRTTLDSEPFDVAFIEPTAGHPQAVVTVFDQAPLGGLHFISLDSSAETAFLPLPLAASLALVPNEDGTTVGASRLLVLSNASLCVVAAPGGQQPSLESTWDLFADMVDCSVLGMHPTGRYAVVPNSSPFSSLGNTVSAVGITRMPSGPLQLKMLNRISANISDPFGAVYGPDPSALLLTQCEKGRLAILRSNERTGHIAPGPEVAGSYPLVGRPAMVRGPGLVVVGALSAVHSLRMQGDRVEALAKAATAPGTEGVIGDVAIEMQDA